MITGNHPFPGKSETERMQRIIGRKLKPPREVDPGIAPELERIVLKALAWSKQERHLTAQAMGQELEAFVRTTGEQVGPAALSAAMAKLFADKIADHDIKLRAFRRQQGDSTGAVEVEPIGPTPEAEDTKSELKKTVAGGPRAISRERSGVSRRWLAIGGGVVVALAAAIGIIASTSGEDPPAKAPAAGPEEPTPGKPTPGEPTAAPEPAAALEAPPPPVETVRITLNVEPPDAVLELDGKPLEKGIGELALPADGQEHALRASAEGHAERTERFVADGDRELSVRLERLPREEKKDKDKDKRKKKPRKKKRKDSGLMKSPYS